MPVEFVWAERGLMNESIGLYDDDRIAVLDLPELRDIDRHLAAYGAHARSELERVTSLLVELLSQDLTEEHAGL